VIQDADHRGASPIALAHVDAAGREHSLLDHLLAVAQGASIDAALFRCADWAYLAGLWHDLGKYRSGFQKYIQQAKNPDAHIEGKVVGREKTHSAAGALWAQQYLAERYGPRGKVVARVLSYLIAGHHAGLDNWYDGLHTRLASEDAQRELADTLAAGPAQGTLAPELELPAIEKLPTDRNSGIPGSFALWVRMLFSVLVDADFLDTEAFMDAGKSGARAGYRPLEVLTQNFAVFMQHKLEEVASRGETDSLVNRIRADVLRQCQSKGERSPGVFTLTVPTGGGKTLSSMAFALRHAVLHKKRRIVFAIPYTSIIEQTANIFRDIFGDDQVVEHHSNADSAPEQETQRSRLACENWDAPVIVTTNVQLFESLFARKTSRCRKLHNLVGSVIVLDEAQLLPVEFLQPILDVLRLLVRDYGVTLVLCTATQPALTFASSFDARRALRGFSRDEVTEIIDNPSAMYSALKRVAVHRPDSLEVKRDWPGIASEVARHEAVLAIVNRRADARELFGLLRKNGQEGLWHLSALMCAQHRTDTIAEIKGALELRRNRLARGDFAAPVRVVSTQLVEAGVDMDFPVVFRAMAGLDSIAQAAGRCNREGRLEQGEVYVFVPPTLPPPGILRQAESTCRAVWHDVTGDPLDLRLFPRYFRKLYADGELDKKSVCEMLRAGAEGDVRFRDAAEAFRLIDDKDSATVIVRYPIGESQDVDQLVAMLRRDGPQRWLMRKLQRYGVTVYQNDIQRLLASGDVREIVAWPGLYVQESDVFYDTITGANVAGAPGDPAAYFVGD
jgi:CRISPR-associated endonuclease/helicase Cas3